MDEYTPNGHHMRTHQVAPAKPVHDLGVEPLIGIRDVATFFGLSQATIRRWVREGKLPSIKIGRSPKFHKSDILRLVKTTMPTTQPTEDPIC